MDGKTLMIENWGSNVSLYSPASRTEGKQGAPRYALVFKRYGDRYFLSGIKLEGSKIAYRLPESKAAAELRAENVSATEETVLATLHTTSAVSETSGLTHAVASGAVCSRSG